MPLPPGLEGWVLGENQTREREGGDIRNLAGILSIQGAMENQRQAALTNPLNLQLLKAKIDEQERQNEILKRYAELRARGAPVPAGILSSEGALATGGAQGDVGPTNTNAARIGTMAQPQPGVLAANGLSLPADVEMEMLHPLLKDLGKVHAKQYEPTPEMRNLVARGIVPGSPQWNAELGTKFTPQGAFSFGQSGAITTDPRFVTSIGDIERAKEAAKAQYTPFLGQLDAQNRPIPQTVGQFVQGVGGGLQPGGAQTPAIPQPGGTFPTPPRGGTVGNPPPVALTPPELAADDQQSRTPANLADLDREIARTTDPRALAILQAERARITGAARPPNVSVAQPGQRQGMGMTPAEIEGAKATGKERAEGGVKFEQSVLDAGRAAQSSLTDLQIIAPNVEKLPTGPLYPTLVTMKNYLNQLGLSVDPNLGPAQATEALLNQMALKVRNPAGGAGMPGAMSDADRQFLVRTIPSLGTSPQGNKMLAKILMGLEQRKIDEAVIVNKMQAANMSSNQIRDALSQYANRNSIAAGLR